MSYCPKDCGSVDESLAATGFFPRLGPFLIFCNKNTELKECHNHGSHKKQTVASNSSGFICWERRNFRDCRGLVWKGDESSRWFGIEKVLSLTNYSEVVSCQPQARRIIDWIHSHWKFRRWDASNRKNIYKYRLTPDWKLAKNHQKTSNLNIKSCCCKWLEFSTNITNREFRMEVTRTHPFFTRNILAWFVLREYGSPFAEFSSLAKWDNVTL